MTRTAPSIAGSTTFGAGRRWLRRGDTALTVALSGWCLFLLIVIIFRHPKVLGRSLRLDLTSQRIHTLSRATLDRLKLVREEISVVYPSFLRADDPVQQAQREVLDRAWRLLDEFVVAQPLIRVAARVDVFARPDEWLKIREQYDLSASQVNRFIFLAGPAHEFRQAVGPDEMASIGESRDPAIVLPEIKSFRAEKAMIDAITRLVERRKRIVYFTQDKEELSLRTDPRREGEVLSLNALRHELETQGIEPRELVAIGERGIPADCQALVIANPIQEHSPAELDAIRRYLRQGGRLLVTLGRRNTGLQQLLEDWGVTVLQGQVRGLVTLPKEQVATDRVFIRGFNRYHPITRPFTTVRRFEMILDAPRALRPGGLEKGLQATVLIEARSDDDPSNPSRGERFYLLRDGEGFAGRKPGNHAIAVAVEQQVPERPPPGWQRLGTRIVVCGGSSFLADGELLRGSHRDFAVNAFAWLLGEEEKATAGGQDWARVVLPATPSIRRFLFLGPVVLLPSFFLAIGAIVWAIRRT